MHLQENTLFDLWPCGLDPGVKVKHNVAHNPLHHVTYAPAKFEAATSNSVGYAHLHENTQNIVQYPLHNVIYVSVVKTRCIHKKLHYLTLQKKHCPVL